MTGDYKTPSTPGTTNPGSTSAGSTSSGSTSSGSTPRRHEAWQPRVQKDPPFNAFESDGARSPDARSPSGTIRDPKRDTAPLQGENDISDEDSLSNEYTPNQDNPTRGGDMPINNRGSQS